MPLIACPECGRQISDRAPACPQCGCPGPSAVSRLNPPMESRSPSCQSAGLAEPPSVPRKRPWFLYGCFCWSLAFAFIGVGQFLDANSLAFAGCASLGAMLVIVGLPVCAFGLLDKYFFRKQHLTIPHPRLAKMAGVLFCLGILAMALGVVIAAAKRPQGHGQVSPAATEAYWKAALVDSLTMPQPTANQTVSQFAQAFYSAIEADDQRVEALATAGVDLDLVRMVRQHSRESSQLLAMFRQAVANMPEQSKNMSAKTAFANFSQMVDGNRPPPQNQPLMDYMRQIVETVERQATEIAQMQKTLSSRYPSAAFSGPDAQP